MHSRVGLVFFVGFVLFVPTSSDVVSGRDERHLRANRVQGRPPDSVQAGPAEAQATLSRQSTAVA